MSDTADDLLLREAEHLARDLLLNVDDTKAAVAALVNSWAPAIQAASDYFSPQAVTPCSQILEIARGLRRDASEWIGDGGTEPRLSRIRELLKDGAAASEEIRRRPQRQHAVLQTLYIATHAVAGAVARYGATLKKDEPTRAHGQLVVALSTRIRSAEHILDAHLSARPSASLSGDPTQALATAIGAWDAALHEALVDKTPDPRVLLVNANVSIGLLRRTADIVTAAAADGHLDDFTVHARLLPTLAPATESWEAIRATWRALAPATTGIPYPVATAAQALHRALYALPPDPRPESSVALRLAIIGTVEAAQLQVGATRRADLKGMASGVSKLTQAVFDQIPEARSLTLWTQLERLDGPTPISIPAQVRAEMMHQAIGTLEASALAASASHGLIERAARRAQPRRETKPPMTRERPRVGMARRP